MQRLLARLGWRSVGIIYGLDEGDAELFFLDPRGMPYLATMITDYRLAKTACDRP
jgi:hypothetical protein